MKYKQVLKSETELRFLVCAIKKKYLCITFSSSTESTKLIAEIVLL